jgi:nicotinate-nucleotide pyrophosphorylase (carboxylating)
MLMLDDISPLSDEIRSLIELAVREDLGDLPDGEKKAAPRLDRTVAVSIPPDLLATGRIVARREGVISGTALMSEILAYYDVRLKSSLLISDGNIAKQGAVVAEISGPAGALLSAERVVLNFLGHLSGIATLTARYVQAAKLGAADAGKPAICDTRKTTPGWRTLEKYAVRCGGGVNHRMGLYDGVMLKDNHLAALRRSGGDHVSLADITRKVRSQLPGHITLWLEVDTLEQFQEALPGGADIILLDNMTPRQMRQAVVWRDDRKSGVPLLEASGGITLENIATIAATGVDRISVGALTHSAPSLDLAMDFIEHA